MSFFGTLPWSQYITAETNVNRREFVLRGIAAGAVATFIGNASAGGHLPKVDPSTATAKALAYLHESTVPNQQCTNCQLFQGKTAWGACAIFPNQEVAAARWCKT